MASIQAGSLAEALEMARELKERGFGYFRGQLQAWPLRPSLWRIAPHRRAEAQLRLKRFAAWVSETPQVAEALKSHDALTAVAQHHGIATAFLDATTVPDIAAFFAQDGAPDSGTGQIQAWRDSDLRGLGELRIVELDVPNLWRLEAQHGLFLVAETAATLDALGNATRITFPHGRESPADLPARTRIYPERASALEVMLTEFFNLLRQQENADLAARSEAVETLNIHDWAPRLSAFAGHAPPVGEGWQSRLITGKGFVEAEREAFATAREIRVKVPGKAAWSGPKSYVDKLRRQFRHQANVFLRQQAPRPQWSLPFLKDGATRARFETTLNDLSDRLRYLRPAPEDWAEAHALALGLACLSGGDGSKAETLAAGLLGPLQDVELRSLSGSRHFGLVSRAGLEAALSAKVGEALLPYPARRCGADSVYRLDIGVHPAHVFAFEPFQRLLVREIAPLMAILEAAFVPSESEPGRRGYAGLASLNALNVSALTRRGDLNKPFHLCDPHAGDAIYLIGDMTADEARAQGEAALAHMLAGGGQSKFVRLMDYADSGDLPVWRADPMSRVHAEALVSGGALVALQPTTCLVMGDTAPDPREDAFGQKGWGGMEMVALMHGVCDAYFGGDGETLQAVHGRWRERYVAEMNEISALPQAS